MALTGILCPMPRIGITPASGMKAFFWAPGTTTKQNTYSDADLAVGHLNSNPVVADSAGLFPAIYLDPGLSYKIAIYPSTEVDPPIGSAYLTQDSAYLPSSHVDPLVCQGRLTLESGVPVSITDQTAKTSILFTPVGGSTVALYDTTKLAWQVHTFTEVTLSLAAFAASTPFDIFLYDNSGTKTLEAVAWTSDTARATALATQNGVYVKTGSANKRYVGTIRTTVTIGQCEDSAAKRFVWNYYNRVPRILRLLESTSWTYTVATWRQANNSATNQVECVVGVAEVALDLGLIISFSNDNAGGGTRVSVAIGEDSTTTPNASCLFQASEADVANHQANCSARLHKYPAVGYHKYCHLEYSTATSITTWIGAATQTQSGLTGVIDG